MVTTRKKQMGKDLNFCQSRLKILNQVKKSSCPPKRRKYEQRERKDSIDSGTASNKVTEIRL